MTSTIDTILDQSEFTLDELLSDDELLQECKALNSRLVTYLSQPDVIGQLFTYVLDEPSPSESHKRCYTYPYVSSELLSCDVTQIHDAINSDACVVHLKRLLDFAKSEGPINLVLAGYYGKVVSTLFKRNTDQFLAAVDAHFEGGRHGYVRALLRHLHLQSVSDLLCTLTTPLETLNAPPAPPPMLMGAAMRDAQRRVAGQGEGEAQVENWLDPSEFARDILKSVRASSSGEVHSLATSLFAHLVMQYGWGVMVADADLVHDIMELCLEARHQTARGSALAMVHELLRLYSSERDIGGDEAATRRDEQVKPLLEAMGEHIEGFVAMLNHEPVLAPHLAPFLRDGGIPDCLLIMPVGSARLQLYALLARALPLLPLEAQCALVQCRLFDIALDAFERYPNNDMLHTHVTALVTYPLKEGSPGELSLAVVQDAHLADRLVALADPFRDQEKALDAEIDGLTPGGTAPRRAPWMGHVTVMANSLVACAEREAAVRAALSDAHGWHEFVQGALATTNANERRTLGGQAPMRGSDLDDSEDDDIYSSKELDLDSMAAALAKHQSRASSASAEFDDDDDDDGGAGGAGADMSEEVERRFGEYMEQKGFLHELDGGLSAISREQDDRAEQGDRSAHAWDADFDGDEGEGGGSSPSPGAGGGDFGTRQHDFFTGGGGGDGDGDGDSSEGSPRERSSPGASGSTFDAVFGDMGGGASAGTSSPGAAGASAGGFGGLGGGAPFEADFGELAKDASAQQAALEAFAAEAGESPSPEPAGVASSPRGSDSSPAAAGLSPSAGGAGGFGAFGGEDGDSSTASGPPLHPPEAFAAFGESPSEPFAAFGDEAPGDGGAAAAAGTPAGAPPAPPSPGGAAAADDDDDDPFADFGSGASPASPSPSGGSDAADILGGGSPAPPGDSPGASAASASGAATVASSDDMDFDDFVTPATAPAASAPPAGDDDDWAGGFAAAVAGAATAAGEGAVAAPSATFTAPAGEAAPESNDEEGAEETGQQSGATADKDAAATL